MVSKYKTFRLTLTINYRNNLSVNTGYLITGNFNEQKTKDCGLFRLRRTKTTDWADQNHRELLRSGFFYRIGGPKSPKLGSVVHIPVDFQLSHNKSISCNIKKLQHRTYKIINTTSCCAVF